MRKLSNWKKKEIDRVSKFDISLSSFIRRQAELSPTNMFLVMIFFKIEEIWENMFLSIGETKGVFEFSISAQYSSSLSSVFFFQISKPIDRKKAH